MPEPMETSQSDDDKADKSPPTEDLASVSEGQNDGTQGGPRSDQVSRWGLNDQVTERDTLGFSDYVAPLKSFLTHDRTTPPLTVSIEGEWGSGKSSFMRQLQKNLDDDGHLTVWFNPWRHEQDETLWASFMIEFFNQMSKDLSTSERLRGHIRFARLRFKWREARWKALQFVPVVAAYLALVTAATFFQAVLVPVDVLAGVGVGVVAFQAWIFRDLPIQKAIQNYAEDEGGLRRWLTGPDYESRVAFVEHFHKEFDKVLDAYVGDRGDVFVFIDDLDRCVLPKAPELLRSINMLIGNDPDVFFVIGIDRETVAAAITAKHKDILPYLDEEDQGDGNERTTSTKNRFGVRYIRKFVQVPFRLPKPSEAEIRKFTRYEVSGDEPPPQNGLDSAAVGSDEIEDEKVLTEVVDMAGPALDDNPRMIKTFINLFRLRGRIASHANANLFDEGLTVYQLGKFVAIGLRWPKLVAELDSDPRLLGELEEYTESHEDIESLSESQHHLRKWLQQDTLWALLRAGERDAATGELDERYSLKDVPVEDLIKISPQVGDPTSSTRSEAVKQAGTEAPGEA